MPRLTLHLPQRREDRRGIVGIGSQLDGAAQRILVKDLRPGAAAVGRTEYAPLLVRTIDVPLGRDQDEVRVLRVHDDAGDVLAVLEPGVEPRAAAIRRL